MPDMSEEQTNPVVASPSPPTPKPTPPTNPLKRKEPPSDDADSSDGPPAPKALSISNPRASFLGARHGLSVPPPPRTSSSPAAHRPSPSPDAEGEQDVEDGDGEGEPDDDDGEEEVPAVTVDDQRDKNGAPAAADATSDLPEEYKNNQIVCQHCGLQINIRDAESGDFTVRMWQAHQAECCPPSSTSRRLTSNGDPLLTRSMVFKPESKGSASIIYTPESTAQSLSHPTTKRRRAKRTEEERIEYLRKDPYVAQFEAYRVLCASCDKWIRLRPNSTFCSIPWDAHRKSCLAKKLSRNSKNAYALDERNNLFSQDPDIRKFDAERLLCNRCDQWLSVSPEDHLNAVQKWLHHRANCKVAPGTGTAPPPPPQGMNGHAVDRPSSSGRPMKDIPRAPPPSGTQLAALTSVVNLASAIGPRGNGQQHPSPSPHYLNGGPPPPPSGRPNGSSGAMNGANGTGGGREQQRGSMSSMSSRERESPFVAPHGMVRDPRDVPSNEGATNGNGHPSPPGGPRHAQQQHHAHHSGQLQHHPQHPSSHNGQRGGHGEQGGGGGGGHGERGPPSPPFHDLTPSTFPPLHESRRRNAEQRADTLRRDHLIWKVEANRVFCRLCSKWVQLRQDSSFCAYPWLQHRAKCIARHQRRAQKIADLNALNLTSANTLIGKPLLHRSASHPHLSHGVDRRRLGSNGHHGRRAEEEMEMEEDELISDSDMDEDPGRSMTEDERGLFRVKNGRAEYAMQALHREHQPQHVPPHLASSSASSGHHRAPGPGQPSRGQRPGQNGICGPGFNGRSNENPRSNGVATQRMAGPSVSRPSSAPTTTNGHANVQTNGHANGNGNGLNGGDGTKKPWKFPPPPPGHPRHNPQVYAAYVATYGHPHGSLVQGRHRGSPHPPPPGSASSAMVMQNGGAGSSATASGMRTPREVQHQHALRSKMVVKNGQGKHGHEGAGDEEDNEDEEMDDGEGEEEADAEGEPEVIDVDADEEGEGIGSRRVEHRVVKREVDEDIVVFDREPSQRDGDREEDGEGDEGEGHFDEELSYTMYEKPHFQESVIYRGHAGPSGFNRRPSSSGHMNGGGQGDYRRYVGAGGYPNGSGNGYSMRRGGPPPPPMAMAISGAPGSMSVVRRPYPVGLADLDSPAGRKQFVLSSVQHLFSTTYESTDELTVSTLLAYVNSAMPVDKHEDFDTAEIVRYLAQLKERGRLVFVGDVVRPGRD